MGKHCLEAQYRMNLRFGHLGKAIARAGAITLLSTALFAHAGDGEEQPAAQTPVVPVAAAPPAAPPRASPEGSPKSSPVPAAAATSGLYASQRITGGAPRGGPSDGTGAFRMSCRYSHMAFDDPIVFPGQPGRSHLHTFFGNASANANSGSQSIANSGASSCLGGSVNRSAYWVPTMVDSRTRQGIIPESIQVYYKSGYNQIATQSLQAFPPGLRMIAGNSNSQSGPVPEWQSYHDFGCHYDGNMTGPTLVGQSIPNCPTGSVVWASLIFPNCWDGVNLDSLDHRAHMAYSGGGRCPSSHPVPIPTITFNVLYRVNPGDDPRAWRLASDNYSTGQPGGYTMHGDWWDGWDHDVVDVWLENCVRTARDCFSNVLGDGRELY